MFDKAKVERGRCRKTTDVQGRAKKDSGRVTHEVLNTSEEWRAKFERRPLEETAGRSEGRLGSNLNASHSKYGFPKERLASEGTLPKTEDIAPKTKTSKDWIPMTKDVLHQDKDPERLGSKTKMPKQNGLPLIFGAFVARAVPAVPVTDNIFPITFVGSIVVPESSSGDTYRRSQPLCSATTHWELTPRHGQLLVFFVSPAHLLSEWIWDSAAGAWRGGPTCSDYITVNGFTVQPGSQVLCATANNSPSSPALLHVAFVSSGAPNTLREASFTTARSWQLAELST
ncbi:hypothetical protein B0H13DRAFT_1926215 [Mycena leptocephala]|nr:hypothetical protein B0H13DRAFT_1926215 [Mycena leptocephala]